jgi:putative alpha-1,2-mannosidase
MALANLLSTVALSALFGQVVAQSATADAKYDVLQYVNQLIGSSNGGNVFSGATLPYGMAKAVADTNSGSNQGVRTPSIALRIPIKIATAEKVYIGLYHRWIRHYWIL